MAGLINALEISKKNIDEIKIVVNGAGAAGIACLKLIINYGALKKNCILCDTKGICYQGRKNGMNEFKEQFAIKTDMRTFEEAS